MDKYLKLKVGALGYKKKYYLLDIIFKNLKKKSRI